MLIIDIVSKLKSHFVNVVRNTLIKKTDASTMTMPIIAEVMAFLPLDMRSGEPPDVRNTKPPQTKKSVATTSEIVIRKFITFTASSRKSSVVQSTGLQSGTMPARNPVTKYIMISSYLRISWTSLLAASARALLADLSPERTTSIVSSKISSTAVSSTCRQLLAIKA